MLLGSMYTGSHLHKLQQLHIVLLVSHSVQSLCWFDRVTWQSKVPRGDAQAGAAPQVSTSLGYCSGP